VLICFSNSLLLRYAKLLKERSSAIEVTVAPSNSPESFAGLLGRTKVMRMNESSANIPELSGELQESGYYTRDGRFCVELIMLVDKETTLVLSKEKEISRAIVITGTIMSLFALETVTTVIKNSEEVRPPRER